MKRTPKNSNSPLQSSLDHDIHNKKTLRSLTFAVCLHIDLVLASNVSFNASHYKLWRKKNKKNKPIIYKRLTHYFPFQMIVRKWIKIMNCFAIFLFMPMRPRSRRSGRGMDSSLQFCQSMGRLRDKVGKCAYNGRQTYAKRCILWQRYTVLASPDNRN